MDPPDFSFLKRGTINARRLYTQFNSLKAYSLLQQCFSLTTRMGAYTDG